MDTLENNLGYTFKNKKLLENALVHSSYANEMRGSVSSNERLEFLGDSVLSIIVSSYIYENFKKMPEGELTRLRSSLVCEKTLCEFSSGALRVVWPKTEAAAALRALHCAFLLLQLACRLGQLAASLVWSCAVLEPHNP